MNSDSVQESLHFPPCDTVLRPCSLQCLPKVQNVGAFPGSLLAIGAIESIAHLRLDGLHSAYGHSTVAVDLSRARAPPNLNELKGDIEGFGELDGVCWLVS